MVTLYLLPSLNQKLMPKLNKELKPGTRIVSHAFDMGDRKAGAGTRRQRPQGLLLDHSNQQVRPEIGRLP